MNEPLETPRVLKVGITGGIGSGKSTVCRLFEALGIPVYDADERAKYLMQHEHYLIDGIKKNFGEEVYENGRLNRSLLAAKVFHDEQKLKLLNALVHPAVFRDTERWVAEQQSAQVPYVIKEAALLIETGSYKQLDKLIVVTAPEELRIQRVSERDRVSATEVMARIKHQLPEETKIKLADYVITNAQGPEELKAQVQKIHQQLVDLSAIKKK